MDKKTKELCQSYIVARRSNPAWQLLAARRAPLVLSCLKQLFENRPDGIVYEDAVQLLAQILEFNVNNEQFDIKTDDFPALAAKELREWSKRKLLEERKGQLLATDALEKALHFMNSLDDGMMTSTASRLATVQREIENLEARLNPDRKSRAAHVRKQISTLEKELKKVESGRFEVLDGEKAIEGIREVYSLAMSLRSDFRRVEDSYRAADKNLRRSIIKAHYHRGEIVDELLDVHDNLLQTPEGKVFHGFYQQLNQSVDLDHMKQRLKSILNSPAGGKALNHLQQSELRLLVTRLVSESLNILRARARSEKDVKNFLKTSIASENHRVGELLNEIFEIAGNENLYWENSAVRKMPSPLPPVAVAMSNLPLIERFRFKSVNLDDPQDLELEKQTMHLDDIEDEFWEALDDLDRGELIRRTMDVLNSTDQKMSLAELSDTLLSSHDLETLSFWIGMAREAGLPALEGRESIEYQNRLGQWFRFNLPKMELTGESLRSIDLENLG
jgi:hypothetical protein